MKDKVFHMEFRITAPGQMTEQKMVLEVLSRISGIVAFYSPEDIGMDTPASGGPLEVDLHAECLGIKSQGAAL